VSRHPHETGRCTRPLLSVDPPSGFRREFSLCPLLNRNFEPVRYSRSGFSIFLLGALCPRAYGPTAFYVAFPQLIKLARGEQVPSRAFPPSVQSSTFPHPSPMQGDPRSCPAHTKKKPQTKASVPPLLSNPPVKLQTSSGMTSTEM